MDSALREALSGEMTPKFLATLDETGRPNCVPVISIAPWDDTTLVFGEFFLNKTRRNLEANNKVGVAVVNDQFASWSLKGTFLGFETTGPRIEWINQQPMFRYNAYTSVRAAGSIRIEEITAMPGISRGALPADLVRVRLRAALARNGGGPCMPLRVAEKFGRVKAARAIAFRTESNGNDGYPQAFTVMACVPAGADRLLLRMPAEVPEGTEVAVAVITQEPVAYQVKGVYAGRRGGYGLIQLTECYSASPPLLGERLYPPLHDNATAAPFKGGPSPSL
ncbi:pyridoxamine 5'-phosphate oxidase family protein [Roseovarius pacificus]|uniref:pyridoxamine 5'-phosphate oxidase family protein n=1 Tax=Roseovarius pacificus TaxID=337701 RepID=UPI002A188FAA|nr:pyridoxamine 5'-phosphate oxidase family protein [Roseovarius pacificus]